MTSRRIVYDNSSGGLFGMVKSVLCALARCDAEGVDEVSVEVRGSPYRADGVTGDLWPRLFMPIGDPTRHHDQETVIAYHPCMGHAPYRDGLALQLNAALNRHIKLLPEVQVAVDRMHWDLTPTTVGLHYRGADGHTVYPHVYPHVYRELLNLIKPNAYPWLLCTDSEEALSILRDPLALVTDAQRVRDLRTGYGIHFQAPDRIRAAHEAQIDAWLLAKCATLICGTSNLSDVVTIINPEIYFVKVRGS